MIPLNQLHFDLSFSTASGTETSAAIGSLSTPSATLEPTTDESQDPTTSQTPPSIGTGFSTSSTPANEPVSNDNIQSTVAGSQSLTDPGTVSTTKQRIFIPNCYFSQSSNYTGFVSSNGSEPQSPTAPGTLSLTSSRNQPSMTTPAINSTTTMTIEQPQV